MFWRKIKSTLPKNYPNLCIKPSPLRMEQMQQDMFGTKTQSYKYFSIRDILGFYAAIQIMFGTVFCSLGGSHWLINWWMLLSSQKGYTRFLWGASDYVWDSVYCSSGGSYWLIHWWMVLYTLIRQLLLALFSLLSLQASPSWLTKTIRRNIINQDHQEYHSFSILTEQ